MHGIYDDNPSLAKRLAFSIAPKLAEKLAYHTSDWPYLPYMLKHRCIFIHIPKCAGTSIVSSLTGREYVDRNHATWLQYHRRSRTLYQRFFKFTFVRDPVDRVLSAYGYLHAGGNFQANDAYFRALILERYPTVDAFVLGYMDHQSIWRNKMLWPQWFFLYDYRLESMVDFIGRYETIDQDVATVFARLGVKRPLSKENVTAQRAEKGDLSEAAIRKIEHLYGYDFELLGYRSRL